MKKIMILYVPILHNGYLNFFKKYSNETECLYILGSHLINEFTSLEKEIRAINPIQMCEIIRSLKLFKTVTILTPDEFIDLDSYKIITAKEGVSERLIRKYFTSSDVIFDDVFLRWDEQYIDSKKPINFNKISTSNFDRSMIFLANEESKKTSDQWRSVGAVLVRDKKIILTSYNKHVPSEHTPYAMGDIRDFIPAGTCSEISSALHAEHAIIVEAAKRGIKLEGADIYVSVFPCPVCAKSIAYSGIKKCFFSKGHATFDGEQNLKSQKVEIILVR